MIVILLVTLVYTWEGGMKAVIWTDVIQTIIYLGGSAAAFFLLLHRIPGGWSEISAVAAAAGNKLQVWDFHFSLTNAAHTYGFWAGVIGRHVPNDGEPRHRPDHRAAVAGRALAAAEPGGIVG